MVETITSAGRGQRLRHIGSLDGLRGAAVVGVLVFHGGHLRGGYLGVDLFFVLSGYLITMLLMTEWRRERTIRLGNFWARRARRLVPALLLLMVGVSLYAHFAALPEELGGIRADGLATMFYVANWRSILAGHTYFQAGLAPSPFEHTWSLAIEEQFYLVWPLLVVGLLRWRNRPDTILRAAAAMAVGSAGLMVGLHLLGITSDNSLYLGTHTRVAAIAMGATLAAWHVTHGHTRNRTTRTSLEGLALVSIVFLGAMWSLTDLGSGLVYAGGLALCGLAVTVVIAAATHPQELVVGKLLSFAPLRWLGLISYGLYLYHWPIYLFLNEDRTGLSGWPLFALQAFVAIDVATLSYFLVEKPIRNGWLPRRAAPVLVPLGVVTTVLVLIVGTLGGVAPITAGAGASLADAGGTTPRLLLVGDSVPYVLGKEGVIPLRRELGVSVINGAQIACTPMAAFGQVINVKTDEPDAVKRDCTQKFPGLITKFHPQIAMLLYGTLDNFDVMIDGRARDQCDPAYGSRWKQTIEAQIRTLSAGGASVVLVTAPGVSDRSITSFFKVPDSMRRAACTNAVLRQVATQTGVALVDLAEFVCPHGGPCVDELDGKKLRSDGVHFRFEVAQHIARWLVPRVLDGAKRGR